MSIYVISNLFSFVVEKLTKCIRQVTGGDVIFFGNLFLYHVFLILYVGENFQNKCVCEHFYSTCPPLRSDVGHFCITFQLGCIDDHFISILQFMGVVDF